MRVLPQNRAERLRFLALLGVMALLVVIFHNQTWNFLTRLPVLYYTVCYSPEEGDIIFQSLPHGNLVDAIEGITHSPYSHCGVVLKNEKNQCVVIEAIFTVHETPLLLWEARGRGGNFSVYRLDPKYVPLMPQFKQKLLAYEGDPYDFDYDMKNKGSAYCSGLVYQAFEQASGEKLGKLEKLRDLDCKPYEEFIKSEQGGGLPLDRVMITPASLALAPQVKEVYQSGL